MGGWGGRLGGKPQRRACLCACLGDKSVCVPRWQQVGSKWLVLHLEGLIVFSVSAPLRS
jgi:hypothetical protein